MSTPRASKLGITKADINALKKALTVVRMRIAAAPQVPSPDQLKIIDKLCDVRNGLKSVIELETGEEA